MCPTENTCKHENVLMFNLNIKKKMFDCEFLSPTFESVGPARFLDGYM